ncbi:MAG: sugar ABC transporter substrate-binding protein [Micropruina sp.]|nr:sugar ABC transporter substrate-binding protein [Micropruina sp.]
MKIRVLAAGAMAVGLALSGCGRSDPGTSAAPATGSAVATAAVTGDLTMWAMGAEGENLPELIKDFTAANPGIKVKVTAVPWDSAHDKFANAITAGTTPDIAMVGTTWMGEFADLDALDPTPGNIDKAKFFPGAQATTEVGGTSFGVPWYVETRLVYYRKDLATKAGLTEVPKDWDSFKAFVQKMKSASGVKYPISLQPGGTGSWQTVMPFAWSNGAELASGDAWTMDTPQMAEAWTYYQSFFTEGLADKAPAAGTTEADFASGKVPMFISGPWMMSAVEKTGGAGFADKYDVFVMPAKQISASFIGGSNLVVFKNTEARDAAWKLADWLTQPDVQVKWYGISTDLPSVQAAWEDPELTADTKLAQFGIQMKTAKAPPTFPTWEQVAVKFDSQVEKVAKQAADVAAALKSVQQEATSIGTGG